MRVFVALPLSPVAAASASRLVPAHTALRAVAPELMHITLAFVGSVPPETLARIEEAVGAAARGHRAFRLRLDHLGRFPAAGPPRVLWLGAGDGASEAGAVGGDVRRALAERGIAFDDKPLRTHVTLARVRDSAGADELREVAALFTAARTQPLEVAMREIVVYESVIGRGGPRYTRRAAVALEAGTE